MSGFPSAKGAIPASAVPSAPVPGRSREETLRAFLAGETILTGKGRPWSRNADSEAVARQELAEIVATRFASETSVPRCPWCHGPRRAEGTRLHCLTPSCRVVGGVQAHPIPASKQPQALVVFFAPPKKAEAR